MSRRVLRLRSAALMRFSAILIFFWIRSRSFFLESGEFLFLGRLLLLELPCGLR